jgi:hypothetical protein
VFLLSFLLTPLGAAAPSPRPAALAGGAAAAVKVPPWLADETARTVPALPPDTEAVVLLDERTVTVDDKGVLSVLCRRATRILRQPGVEEGRRLVLAETYDAKVKSMTGWAVTSNGALRQTTMKEVISSSLAADTLYMDARILMLIVPDVDPGSVVGFEWREVRTPPTVEDAVDIQGRFPVLRTRYSLALPPRWQAHPTWINWPNVELGRNPSAPAVSSFEVRDVPAVGDEPYMPDERALAARFVVRLQPPEGEGPDSFADWNDMGAWYTGLSEPRRAPDSTIADKARELTAGADSPLGRITALARFVQRDIRYVSVQIGVGGFQPHPAPDILKNRYGDCKDKATLLAALLRTSGLDSRYLLVNTARGVVTPGSPVSLYSFNHAILAVRLPDEVPDAGLDALVRHPRLGRLLVFDPTMPTTPVGRLPYYLQDNTALLVDGDAGELVRLPSPAPEGNALDRSARLILSLDGTLSGRITETRRGAAADSLRYRMQASTESDRRKFLETFLSQSLGSFSLRSFEFRGLEDAASDLVLSYDIMAPAYAKKAGGYLVLRPRVVGTKAVDLASRDRKPRRHPIDLETTLLARDEFTVELPPAWTVEGLPAPVELEAGFAAYRSRTEAEGGRIVYRREYRVTEAVVPAARFDRALEFFLAVGAEEQRSLLLKTGGEGKHP